MTQPLSGMTVLEVGGFITVPYASMMLADMGATVIKIERPGGGDPFRQFKGGNYSSPHFRAYNRSKKSLVLDLTKTAGQEIVKKLLAKADLLIENNRPGVMNKFGLAYEDLRVAFPRLVYCSVTGFGPDGPSRDRPAFDTIGQALSGMLSLYVAPDDPKIPGAALGDCVTGLFAFQAAFAGLMQRERSGKGCFVETNMMAACMAFMQHSFTDYYTDHTLPDMCSKTRLSMAFAFTTADRKLISIHLSSPPKFWDSFVKAIAVPEMATDPRFATRAERLANYEILRAELGAIFVRKTRDQWIELLNVNDVPFAPVYTFDEPASDPQVRHLDLFYQATHPRAMASTLLKRPVWIDGDNGYRETASAPPLLGEHSAELLGELGLSKAEIERLIEDKIVEGETAPK